jgi:hypothetical protein
MHGTPKVNNPGRSMTDDFDYSPPPEEANPDDVAIVGWLRWWHWLILVGLFFAGLLYYPLWRFEQNWNHLQVGDSFDRVKQLLGDPGKASYSMQGAGPSGNDEAYIYSRYWRTYEVLVSATSRRVTAKHIIGGNSQTPPPAGATQKQ